VQAQGPFAEPDSPGILLVKGAPGIDQLADEIEAYHYVWLETVRGKSKDVYRDNDNRIAALEYANEEWEENPKPTPITSVANPHAPQRGASPHQPSRRPAVRTEWRSI
jgi:hypothetical protein